MRNNINSVLKEVLLKVKPSKDELKETEKILKDYLKKIKRNMQKRKINADIFIGGSFAKKTMIKKDSYDIDIFIRFDKKYKNEILSDLTEKILQGTRSTRIHGSRDYFKIKIREDLFLEIVPVKRIQNPREAENVTDLSYSHVNYIKKKIKSEKLLDEIRLAKAFCYANNSYGAESYVQGFSGYGLELLVYHYKSFLKFIKAVIKMDINNKNIIDIEKHHKSKNSILMDLNEAKLKSPVILVDPTYKQRNVLAALSEETFRNFQNVCMNFLKKSAKEFFIPQTVNIEKIKLDANKRGFEFVLLKIETNKQEGDVAGSKMLKFYRHLTEETGKFFEIKGKGFEYQGGKIGRAFFVVKKKDEILITGPMIVQEKHARIFKDKYKKVLIKNGRLYAKIYPKSTIKQFLQNWNQKNREKIKDMSITEMVLTD